MTELRELPLRRSTFRLTCPLLPLPTLKRGYGSHEVLVSPYDLSSCTGVPLPDR